MRLWLHILFDKGDSSDVKEINCSRWYGQAECPCYFLFHSRFQNLKCDWTVRIRPQKEGSDEWACTPGGVLHFFLIKWPHWCEFTGCLADRKRRVRKRRVTSTGCVYETTFSYAYFSWTHTHTIASFLYNTRCWISHVHEGTRTRVFVTSS